MCPILWNLPPQDHQPRHTRLLGGEAPHPDNVVKMDTHPRNNKMVVDWQEMSPQGPASRMQKSQSTGPNLSHIGPLPRPERPSLQLHHPPQ